MVFGKIKDKFARASEQVNEGLQDWENIKEKWDPRDLSNWVKNPDPGGAARGDKDDGGTDRNSANVKHGRGNPERGIEVEKLKQLDNLELEALEILKYSEKEIETIIETAEADLDIKKKEIRELRELMQDYHDLKYALGEAVGAIRSKIKAERESHPEPERFDPSSNGGIIYRNALVQHYNWRDVREKARNIEQELEEETEYHRLDSKGVELEEQEYERFLQQFREFKEIEQTVARVAAIITDEEDYSSFYDPRGLIRSASGKVDMPNNRDWQTISERIGIDNSLGDQARQKLEDNLRQNLEKLADIEEGDHALFEMQEKLEELDEREMELEREEIQEVRALLRDVEDEEEGLLHYVEQLESWLEQGIFKSPEKTRDEIETMARVVRDLEDKLREIEQIDESELEEEEGWHGEIEAGEDMAAGP